MLMVILDCEREVARGGFEVVEDGGLLRVESGKERGNLFVHPVLLILDNARFQINW
jgi:hypothetical protein